MSVSGVILRHRADTQQSNAQHLRQNLHLVKPPEVDLKISNPSNRKPGWGDALASAPSLCQIGSLAKSSARELCRTPIAKRFEGHVPEKLGFPQPLYPPRASAHRCSSF